jgi:hypothetical protein
MQPTARGSDARIVPKRRQRHHSYDESVDEPPRLIAEESVEVEAEVPADENEPMERVEADDAAAPPAFEEE